MTQKQKLGLVFMLLAMAGALGVLITLERPAVTISISAVVFLAGLNMFMEEQ